MRGGFLGQIVGLSTYDDENTERMIEAGAAA
jgi:hypothetical protein